MRSRLFIVTCLFGKAASTFRDMLWSEAGNERGAV
jgi:hypothetical protein